jgi:putative redox protein
MAKSKITGSASAKNNGELYKTSLVTGSFNLTADEPIEYGGGASAPAPIDYLCMSLASCKAITVRMYAQRKEWNVDQVNVNVNFVKGDQMASGLNTFYCEVQLSGNLSDDQRKRLLQIAAACPVERLLTKLSEVVTILE